MFYLRCLVSSLSNLKRMNRNMVPADIQTVAWFLLSPGMKAEARIAAGAAVSVIASGGNRSILETALDNVFEANIGAVLSFGIAGGLAPGLPAGTALVARKIVSDDGEYECDRAWSQRLATALGGAPIVDMAGIDEAVATPADKRALHIATRAAAADMESHIAARFAAERNLPFAAFRVVADPAERHVPPAALAGIGKTGRVTVGPVLRSLARAPGQFPHLVENGARCERRVHDLIPQPTDGCWWRFRLL